MISVVELHELCLNGILNECLGFFTGSECCRLSEVVAFQLELNQDGWVV